MGHPNPCLNAAREKHRRRAALLSRRRRPHPQHLRGRDSRRQHAGLHQDVFPQRPYGLAHPGARQHPDVRFWVDRLDHPWFHRPRRLGRSHRRRLLLRQPRRLMVSIQRVEHRLGHLPSHQRLLHLAHPRRAVRHYRHRGAHRQEYPLRLHQRWTAHHHRWRRMQCVSTDV